MLWWLADDPRLSRNALDAINDAETFAVASAASLWEVSIKRAVGKLQAPADLVASVAASGVDVLSITAEHGWAAGALPLHHRDPFDRVLVAQAQLEGLTIVTRDPQIARYQVAVLPA